MTIYYIILTLVIILLILVSFILVLAFMRGEKPTPKHDAYKIPPELKGLHDKFLGEEVKKWDKLEIGLLRNTTT